MVICGIIAEYNPFHLGHAHQMAQARQLSGCDYLMVAMGGSFTQRGEPMVIDKWTRARMALECGADLVVELPAMFATQRAQAFAMGGVSLLHGLGANALSFGSETEDLSLLWRMADMIWTEDEALSTAIRMNLDQGKSHARARGEALADRLGLPRAQIDAPNTALAIEYLSAIRRLNAPMEVYPIKRLGAYHGKDLEGFASATAIREALAQGDLAGAQAAMPAHAASPLHDAWPHSISDRGRLDNLILDRLRNMTIEEIGNLPDVSEGLEHRIKKFCDQAADREDLIGLVKCKRYTYARLSRLCAHAILGMQRTHTNRLHTPSYARVLGFRNEAKPLLKHIKEHASLPLITQAIKLKDDECFAFDRRATDLMGLCTSNPAMRRAGRDFIEQVVIV